MDKETYEVVEELTMEYPSRTEVDANSVILYYPDRIDIYDWSFVLEDSIELPDSMTSVVNEERIIGMDLSPDHQEVVYADRDGLKLYHPQSGSEGMVIETIPAKDEYPDGRPSTRYFYYPRFVAGGRKVIATLSGYDYNSGFICYDLYDSSYEVFDDYLEGIDTSNVYYDNGMLYQIETEISLELEGQEESTWGYRLQYYDFTTSETAEFMQELIGGEMDYVLFQDMLYNGSSQVAFLTISSNQISHINRLDLDSGQVDGNLLSIEGALVSIIGVLQDGRIICDYNRNPAENGLIVIQ